MTEALDHRAVPFATAIHREVQAGKGLPEYADHGITTSLGRQGLVEVAVVLAAMLPADSVIEAEAPRRLHAAVHARQPEEIAAVLGDRDRAQMQALVLTPAGLLPAKVVPKTALAWV